MHSFTPLLFLLWCPWLVLGGYQISVQDGGSPLHPGGTINYAVTANPLPGNTLGVVLIPVQGSNPNAPRAFIPSSLTMSFSPVQATIGIPGDMPQAFYTVDIHANTSVYSPLLASSNVFEIAPVAAPPATTPTPQAAPQTTTQQVIVTQQANTPSTPVQNTPVAPVNPSTTPTTAQAANSDTKPAVAPPSASGSTPTNAASGGSASAQQLSAANSGSTGAATPTGGSASSDSGTTASKKSSSAIGPAVGGAIAGIFVILLLLFFWRRRMQKKTQGVPLDDETANNHVRYQDREGAASPGISPFGGAFREFSPNRPMTQVSPFVMDSERSTGLVSPDPTNSAKHREAYGAAVHTHNHSIGSSGYLDSSIASNAGTEQLRSERERLLGEISALRSRGGQNSAYAQSSVSGASSSGRDGGGDEEMRNRLDMLSQHVQRLESALERAVNVYDAPPMYNQAPSQRDG